MQVCHDKKCQHTMIGSTEGNLPSLMNCICKKVKANIALNDERSCSLLKSETREQCVLSMGSRQRCLLCPARVIRHADETDNFGIGNGDQISVYSQSEPITKLSTYKNQSYLLCKINHIQDMRIIISNI